MTQMSRYSLLDVRIKQITQKVHFVKSKMGTMKKQSEKSAITKSRVHADIHRFQFAKSAHEMKQKYCLQIEELQLQITSFSEKFTKIQNSYALLQKSFDEQQESKKLLESQLISVKKSFNAEIVNYQNVQQRNLQNEMMLNDQIKS